MRAEVRRKFAILGVGLAWALLAPGVSSATSFNPELWELTGGPTRKVYYWTLCTFEQYLAVRRPGDNWERNASAGNPRVLLHDAGTSVPPMAPPGTPLGLDLIPEIEGDDHQLADATWPVHTLIGDKIELVDNPAVNAVNERLRQEYIDDCVRGMRRWNQVIKRARIDFKFGLPHRAFHRALGSFASSP